MHIEELLAEYPVEVTTNSGLVFVARAVMHHVATVDPHAIFAEIFAQHPMLPLKTAPVHIRFSYFEVSLVSPVLVGSDQLKVRDHRGDIVLLRFLAPIDLKDLGL